MVPNHKPEKKTIRLYVKKYDAWCSPDLRDTRTLICGDAEQIRDSDGYQPVIRVKYWPSCAVKWKKYVLRCEENPHLSTNTKNVGRNWSWYITIQLQLSWESVLNCKNMNDSTSWDCHTENPGKYSLIPQRLEKTAAYQPWLRSYLLYRKCVSKNRVPPNPVQ
jgi:hypothetical protein